MWGSGVDWIRGFVVRGEVWGPLFVGYGKVSDPAAWR